MLEAGRGHVVNMASGLAYTPRATESAYVTTKAAVLALSRCLRADWHDQGVGVSAVCPGVINTGIIGRTRFTAEDSASGPALADRAAAEKIFRRGHPPTRVADAVLRGVERDRAVVPVGWESHLAWWFSRLGPVRVQELVARQPLR
jgi:short-subunit dehydrogenase